MPAPKDVLFLDYFDDAKGRDYREKIHEAIERYVEKFNERPNLCLVHPSVPLEHPDIEVRAVEAGIQPNHFWVGYEPKGA